MTDHERLREQYVDALFALLMEGVAESEGEEALRLNEELKKDPNAEVPKALLLLKSSSEPPGGLPPDGSQKWLWSQF